MADVSVTVDPEIEAILRRLKDGAVGALIDQMRAAGQEILAHAYAEWPIKTGKSKAALKMDVILTRESIGIRFPEPYEYVRYIRAKKLKGKNPWWEYIRHPAKAAATKLTREAGAEIAAVVGGRL